MGRTQKPRRRKIMGYRERGELIHPGHSHLQESLPTPRRGVSPGREEPRECKAPERDRAPAKGRKRMSRKRDHAVSQGISFGSALAIAISWSTHQSILWAILHGFFSWFYVLYFALTR